MGMFDLIKLLAENRGTDEAAQWSIGMTGKENLRLIREIEAASPSVGNH